MKTINRASLLALAIAGFVLRANPAHAFVVEDTGISPGEVVNISVSGFYTGQADVGIINLVVNGVSEKGFCIDPFHFSVGSSPGYEFRSLADASKPPGPMGAAKAEEISKLWSMVYSPEMTAEHAAGFQVAIWEIVGGDNFSVSGNDYGAGVMLQNLETYSGAGAQLIALSGPGQDYVTPLPMPDAGSALTLFALAALGLAWIHRFGLLGSECKVVTARHTRLP